MESLFPRTNVPVPVYMPLVQQREIISTPANQALPFIEANTKEVEMSHLTDDCIIPVFSKDNEVTISHQSFIETVFDAAYKAFPQEQITEPVIRVSHVVKGRIPEAIHKPVSQLLESDKTIYYERMMFCLEIPTIYQDIDGSRLNLTIGGVRAYNEQNLYAKKSPEKFRIFIGFKNMVCCNLCVSTDGYKSTIRVMDTNALFNVARDLFLQYDMNAHPGDESVHYALTSMLPVTAERYFAFQIAQLILQKRIKASLADCGYWSSLSGGLEFYPKERWSLLLSCRPAATDGLPSGVEPADPAIVSGVVRDALEAAAWRSTSTAGASARTPSRRDAASVCGCTNS